MEKRIFISHSSKDNETASIICDALENNGMKCWIAPRDIPYGKEWAGEISKAIMNSSAFLFLSSGNSNASGQVSREIQLAIENQIPIIPIRLDGAEYSDTNKYYLATIHCMFQYDASRVAKLVSDISKAVPKSEEEQKEEKQKAKQNKVRSPRFGLKLVICMLFMWLCAAGATAAYFFTDLSDIIKYAIIGAAAVIGLIPLLIVRKKAISSFKINKKTVSIIVALALAGAVGIGIGGVAVDDYLWNVNMLDKYRVVLTAPDDMTAAEFKDAAEKVAERMEIIADGQRYSIDITAGEVELIVPFEIFGELTANDILKCYITRAMKLYLTTTAWGEDAPDPALVEVTPADIESAVIRKGKIPGEPEIDADDVIDIENYEYIEITLTDEFVEKNREAIKLYGDRAVFAQDKVELSDGYYYFDTFTSGNEKVFYVSNNDRIPTLNELFIHNMTTEHAAASLNVKIDVAALWENVGDGSVFGKNQCAVDSLEDETVSVSYRGSVYSDISEGKWLDTVAALKARLDTLEQPYAFGYGVNDPYLIVVRTNPDKLDIGILELLSASSMKLSGGLVSASLPYNFSSEKAIELITDKGISTLKIKAVDETEQKKFATLIAAAKELDKDRIYIRESTNDTPVISAKATDNGKFIFDCDPLGNKLTEENDWLAALTYAIYDHSLAVFLSLEQYDFGASDRDFDISLADTETESKIKELAEVRFIEEDGGNIRIGLNLPVDEKLPENALKTGKAIFELLDFENSSYNTASIYLIAEEGEERARIFFSKQYNSFYSTDEKTDNGYVYTYGIFKGGRIQRDKEAFLSLLAQDEFYSSLNHTADGNLYFD